MTLAAILRIAFVCILLQKTSFTSPNVAFALTRLEVLRDPNIYYTTTELACSEGYPAQEHKVVTEDGYILTVHRIPNGRHRPKIPHTQNHYHKIHLNHHPDFNECMNESFNETSRGFPVLFVHGILMASDLWLLQGSGRDLAYIMADNGYDVWFANVRGNFFSRKHISLDPADPKFWDFSFHEHGMYDIPATIDYILNVTKRDKLGYLGYSMGTTAFFTMASLRPEYRDKILGFTALAPVAYMKQKHMGVGKRNMLGFLDKFAKVLKEKNLHELFPRNKNVLNAGKNYCTLGSRVQNFCYDLVMVFMGYNSKLVLRNIVHLYATHAPTGSSLKAFIHYLQNIKSNAFRLFDYGREKNQILYGSPVPPDYPLWNITVPVYLIYSDKDFYYEPEDIEDLSKVLPNVWGRELKHNFNHVDFIWWYKGKDLLFPKILSFFKTIVEQHEFQTKQKNSVLGKTLFRTHG